jgi:purine catabolism regulator
VLVVNTTFKLTVQDILDHPIFQEAEVQAGSVGLGREIKWVHIMEVTEIRKLLNGNELILTTGVGWHEKQRTALSFLKQLIDAGVAGMCIELGTYTSGIPKEMIELAEEHNFPLIVFNKEVRFIDITQNLNTLLINKHYKMVADLEGISQKLNQLLLLPDAFKRVLRFLNEVLDVQVVYQPLSESKAQFFPNVPLSEQETILDRTKGNLTEFSSSEVRQYEQREADFAHRSIQAMGHKFADLFIFSNTNTFNEYELLVLDRCAIGLSQDLLRMLYVEERKKTQDHQWTTEWLKGKHNLEDINAYLATLKPQIKPNGGGAIIFTYNSLAEDSAITYNLAVFRSIFEQQGFYPIITFETNQIIAILINKRGKKDWKTRIRTSIEHIEKTDEMKQENSPTLFGIGKLTDQLEKIHESYLMAKEALVIQKRTGLVKNPFYEDLHIFRLISIVNKNSDLKQFVYEYLGHVIAYDNRHDGSLLETLRVLLDCNGSKKEASKKLFIVRQTLYHRIEKLKELLGADFMQTEKRLVLEFSLCAWMYMKERN